MVPVFGRNPTEICVVFNYVPDYIYNKFNHLLRSWNLEPRYFTGEQLGIILQRNSSEGNPIAKLPWFY